MPYKAPEFKPNCPEGYKLESYIKSFNRTGYRCVPDPAFQALEETKRLNELQRKLLEEQLNKVPELPEEESDTLVEEPAVDEPVVEEEVLVPSPAEDAQTPPVSDTPPPPSQEQRKGKGLGKGLLIAGAVAAGVMFLNR